MRVGLGTDCVCGRNTREKTSTKEEIERQNAL